LSRRYEELDSLRGLAAISVFIYHIGLISILPMVIKPFKLANGHAAVMLFFVLSGFVLSLPILKTKKINYLPYIIKRVFRIYVPYLAAIFLSIIAAFFLSTGPIASLGNWFNLSWTHKITPGLIIEHITLLGNIHSDAFDNVIWSLIHELRISLLFPFVILLVNRINWKMNILLCLFLSSLRIINNHFHLQTSNGFLITYFDTAHYLAFFILGTIIAMNRENLIKLFQKQTFIIKSFLLFVSLIIYNFTDRLASLVHFSNLSLNEYITAIASCSLIIISLSSRSLGKLLLIRPIQLLGKISYSLYLYHLPVLLSMVHLFYGKLPLLTIYILSIVAGLAISALTWFLIENPSMHLGKTIAGRIKNTKSISHNTKEIA
jgi:peptidoglycan/LPS O-acetylase OafA/YrhL